MTNSGDCIACFLDMSYCQKLRAAAPLWFQCAATFDNIQRVTGAENRFSCPLRAPPKANAFGLGDWAFNGWGAVFDLKMEAHRWSDQSRKPKSSQMRLPWRTTAAP